MPWVKRDGFSKFTQEELLTNDEFQQDMEECLYDMLLLYKQGDKDFGND